MRKAEVRINGTVAGILVETDDRCYVFKYDEDYLCNPHLPAISLAFPKRREEYFSDELFPFFFNMLSEGVNKTIQCRTLKIDEDDAFGLLLATAMYDTIGAITINKL